MFVLVGERRRVLGERLRIELVRRHVGEVARAVRALGEERCALGRVAQLLRAEVPDDDPLDGARRIVVLRLPASGGVAAEDGALDERRGLLWQRQRQALVEQPAERAADAAQRLRRRRTGGAERLRVDAVAPADSGGDDARRRELAVGVQDERLAARAAQLARAGEGCEAAAELVVEDTGAVAAAVGRVCDGDGERVHRRLPRRRDLDRDPHVAD